MDIALLVLHSLLRWILLIALLSSIIMSFRGWKNSRSFTPFDALSRKVATIFAHLQLLVGIMLYITGNTLTYLLNDFKSAMSNGETRFFSMEHSTLMILAVAFITIGTIRSKRKKSDTDRHRSIALWFCLGLLIILIAIPWPFSPLANRPFLRGF
ncbi:MAG: hypothetical protein HXX13_06365 [Bacteroidetes bacterium]|nr:hypothetical protein [Bacteroidota bacterium]